VSGHILRKQLIVFGVENVERNYLKTLYLGDMMIKIRSEYLICLCGICIGIGMMIGSVI